MKEAIQKVLTAELSPMQRMLCGDLADKIAKQIEKESSLAYVFMELLLDAGMEVYLDCEGELLNEHEDNTVESLMEHIYSVDDVEIIVKKDGLRVGWVQWTNWNDEHESICDYTCGLASAQLVDIIESDLPQRYRFPE
jgi:hypothetical protein